VTPNIKVQCALKTYQPHSAGSIIFMSIHFWLLNSEHYSYILLQSCMNYFARNRTISRVCFY